MKRRSFLGLLAAACVAPLAGVAKALEPVVGVDLARGRDFTVFRRTTIEWVPSLNDDTTNPIYDIKWAEMIVVSPGMYEKELCSLHAGLIPRS